MQFEPDVPWPAAKFNGFPGKAQRATKPRSPRSAHRPSYAGGRRASSPVATRGEGRLCFLAKDISPCVVVGKLRPRHPSVRAAVVGHRHRLAKAAAWELWLSHQLIKSEPRFRAGRERDRCATGHAHAQQVGYTYCEPRVTGYNRRAICKTTFAVRWLRIARDMGANVTLTASSE